MSTDGTRIPYRWNMTASPRHPSVLAYKAVRDAATTADARLVYDAMKASGCHTADTCTLSKTCPFQAGCLTAGSEDTAGPAT